MKKIILIIGILFMTGCSSITKDNVTIKDGTFSNEEEFVYTTYSTAVLLSGMNSSSASTLSSEVDQYSAVNLFNTRSSTSLIRLSDDEETEVESNIEAFNEYYGMLKPFLDEGSKDVFTVIEKESSNENYEVEMEITIKLSDRNETMVFYYNEDDEGDFEGQVVIGNDTYQLAGENEKDEDESKLKVKAYLDDLNYVKMIVENEETEIKYEYEVSRDGVIEKSRIKIENEDDEFKVEIELEIDGEESSYTLKKEFEDGKETTKVEYEVNGEEGVIFVEISTNEQGEEIVTYRIKAEGKKEKEIHEKSTEINDDDDDDNEDNESI